MVAVFAIPLVATLWIWRIKERKEPGFPRWTLAFPFLAMFLLTNKIWSPQYALWLLPWFALTATRTVPFVLYQLSELLVFYERFEYFERIVDHGVASYTAFATSVIVRGVLLLWCVVVWIRTPTVVPARVVRAEPERAIAVSGTAA